MFNKYYQDELLYLRESGREFAEANPEAARFLAQPGADPDVERMLDALQRPAFQRRPRSSSRRSATTIPINSGTV